MPRFPQYGSDASAHKARNIVDQPDQNVSARKQLIVVSGLSGSTDIMRPYQTPVRDLSVNEQAVHKLSSGRPQGPVHNLLTRIAVGDVQRREIKQRRGFQPDRFGYNESPTSSCQTFCWKARHSFDVPFF